MLDINLIRTNPDAVKALLAKLFDDDAVRRIDVIVDLDSKRRAVLTEAETLQQGRNKLNKNYGRLRGDKRVDDAERGRRAALALEAIRAGSVDTAADILTGEADGSAYESSADFDDALERLTERLGTLGDMIDEKYQQAKDFETRQTQEMLWLPNLPHESVPVHESEEANVPHAPQGVMRQFSFTPKPHWELGVELDIIDFERGIKMAGARGYLLKGWGARLQTALTNLFLDMAHRKGYEEIYVPFMVKEDMLIGSGQFPKFKDMVYFDPDADIYMLPTAEVALANMYRDEIIDEAMLPINVVGHTPCFRRERMSAGKDVRGIKRVHQFQKVELFKFTTPETSYQALEDLAEDASDVCRALNLPFRRLEIVSGDLGFSATKKYDIEMYAPGCDEWLEVSSCSNTEAFQARRANIKYRPADKKKPDFVHTLNGSGLATPRVIIAIMENYQRADGSIEIPEVLRPYLGGAEVIEPRK